MKTENEIREHLKNLKKKLDDTEINPESDYDMYDLQVAIEELMWILT